MIASPVRVITIEREYGSRGGEFAHDLAARLGWRLLDSELLTAAARKACVPEEAAAQFDERLDPWYYRYGKVFWQDQLYSTATESEDKVFNCERMYALIKEEMLEQAKVGDCVIVGRGAPYFLRERDDTFHVFLYAPRSEKLRRIQALGRKLKDAEDLVDTRRVRNWCIFPWDAKIPGALRGLVPAIHVRDELRDSLKGKRTAQILRAVQDRP